MPKPGVPQSRARRATLAAKAEARRPIDVEAGDKPRSTLAAFMRRPSKDAEQRLRAASQAGELTTIDVAAALAQDVIDLTRLARQSAEDVEAKRPLYVARQRALKLLVSVIEAAPAGGASVVVEIVWPAEFAGFDPGDPVRTKSGDVDAPTAAETAPETPPAAKPTACTGWE